MATLTLVVMALGSTGARASSYELTDDAKLNVDGVECAYIVNRSNFGELTKSATVNSFVFSAGDFLRTFSLEVECDNKSPFRLSVFILVKHDGSYRTKGYLPFLESTSSFEATVATDTAFDPYVVGYSTTDFGPYHAYHAFRYNIETGQMLDLGTLDAGNAAGQSVARGVSDDGSVVVGYSDTAASFPYKAFRWTESGGMEALTAIYPAGYSKAFAVSGDGKVIVGESQINSNGREHAFRWTQGGGMVDLGAFDGPGTQTDSRAAATNLDGSVVVGVDYYYYFSGNSPVFGSDAFRWTTGSGMVNLGRLPGDASAYATDISNDGRVVVGISSTGLVRDDASSGVTYDDGSRAFRWTSSTGMADLNELTANAGLDMTGTTLISALNVSADGRHITGTAFTPESPNDRTAYSLLYGDATTGDPTPVAAFEDIFGTASSLTTFTETQARQSLDATAADLGNLLAQHNLVSGALFDRFGSWGAATKPDLTALGAVGSLVGGVRGHLPLANRFTLEGGVALGQLDFRSMSLGSDLLGAAGLRYDFARGAILSRETESFIEATGTLGQIGSLGVTRPYATNGGSGTGFGRTSAGIGSLAVRAGVIEPVGPRDKVGVAAEIGGHWLSLAGYAEAGGAGNPFPATIAARSISFATASIAGQWMHAFSDELDLTLTAALSHAFAGSGGLSADFTGIGTVTGAGGGDLSWGEVGAELSYHVTDRAELGLFASATVGMGGVESKLHVGASFDFHF